MALIRDTKMQPTHEANQAATTTPTATKGSSTASQTPATRYINEYSTDLNVMLRMPDLSAVRHLLYDEDKLSKTEIAGVYMNEQPIDQQWDPSKEVREHKGCETPVAPLGSPITPRALPTTAPEDIPALSLSAMPPQTDANEYASESFSVPSGPLPSEPALGPFPTMQYAPVPFPFMRAHEDQINNTPNHSNNAAVSLISRLHNPYTNYERDADPETGTNLHDKIIKVLIDNLVLYPEPLELQRKGPHRRLTEARFGKYGILNVGKERSLSRPDNRDGKKKLLRGINTTSPTNLFLVCKKFRDVGVRRYYGLNDFAFSDEHELHSWAKAIDSRRDFVKNVMLKSAWELAFADNELNHQPLRLVQAEGISYTTALRLLPNLRRVTLDFSWTLRWNKSPHHKYGSDDSELLGMCKEVVVKSLTTIATTLRDIEFNHPSIEVVPRITFDGKVKDKFLTPEERENSWSTAYSKMTREDKRQLRAWRWS